MITTQYGLGQGLIMQRSRLGTYLLLALLHSNNLLLSHGCKRGPTAVSVRSLPHDVTIQLAEETLQSGEMLYATFKVPPSPTSLTAIVTASWSRDHLHPPVWIFLSKGQLPDRSSADWASVFYRLSRSSRIQVSPAISGVYYILLECKVALTDLKLSLTLGDTEYLRGMETMPAETLDLQQMELSNEIDV